MEPALESVFAEYLAHLPVFVRRIDGEIIYWTNGASELYGFEPSEALGRSAHELLKTVFPRPLDEINASLRDEGRWGGLLRHVRKDRAEIWTESRWWLRQATPDGRGLVVEANTDVSERENLARELDHRVKNTLAVVSALARMTLGNGDPDAVQLFQERLIALTAAHDLLVRRHWGVTDLREVLDQALRPFLHDGRITFDGPSVPVPASSVVAYSLVFHELGTNALKHGALSSNGGRIHLSWRTSGASGENLHLVWRESGGQTPAAEPAAGFGTKLLQRIVAAELGGPVVMRFEPSGLVCEIDGRAMRGPRSGE